MPKLFSDGDAGLFLLHMSVRRGEESHNSVDLTAGFIDGLQAMRYISRHEVSTDAACLVLRAVTSSNLSQTSTCCSVLSMHKPIRVLFQIPASIQLRPFKVRHVSTYFLLQKYKLVENPPVDFRETPTTKIA